MAQRSHPHGTTDALEEIDSGFERMARWVAEHSLVVAGAIGLVLVAGGAFELLRSRAERREVAASNALDEVHGAYLAAMGAQPGALVVPELANPEAASRIRAEYVEKYRSIAQSHAGTLAASLAWLEAADLLAAQGDTDASLASLQSSLAEQGGNPRLAGLIHQRIAQLHEDRGNLAEAAAAHEAAAGFAEFPLRYVALADAARCYAQAGQRDRALVLLERVESEAKEEFALSAPLRSLLRELRAARPS